MSTRTDDSPFAPPLASMQQMQELMTLHYLAGHTANETGKVAWVTSGAPVEVLTALDFHLVYPENHGALCGARKVGDARCGDAEAAGYSHDLCSYARTDIGTLLSGVTPVGKLPRPDLLLCCTNICQTVLYWYTVLAEHCGCPLVVIDTPFLYREASPFEIDYVRRQLEDELVPAAEQVAGRALDPQALEGVWHEAKRASELWLAVLDRAQHRPAPLSAFDGFLLMGPIVNLRGRPETTALYEQVLAELDERIAQGVAAVKGERIRLLWDNLPIWYRLSKLSRFLAERGANLVASTYTYAWGELAPVMDPAEPWLSSARVYLHAILNRSTGHKLASMRTMCADFSIDGVILHSDRSCKPYSLGQIDQRERLAHDVGVPALLLEADHNDARVWSDEQGFNRLEAFLETLEARP